jgi:hypothetical protein
MSRPFLHFATQSTIAMFASMIMLMLSTNVWAMLLWTALIIWNFIQTIRSLRTDAKFSKTDMEIELHKLEIAGETVSVLSDIKEQLDVIENKLPKPRKRKLVAPKKK